MLVTDTNGNSIENARVGCADSRVDYVENFWTGDSWLCEAPDFVDDPPCVTAPDWIPWEGETLALVCVDADAGPGWDVSEFTVVYVPEVNFALALAIALVTVGAIAWFKIRRSE